MTDTTPSPAMTAATALADDDQHVHLVSGSATDCISGHCPDVPELLQGTV